MPEPLGVGRRVDVEERVGPRPPLRHSASSTTSCSTTSRSSCSERTPPATRLSRGEQRVGAVARAHRLEPPVDPGTAVGAPGRSRSQREQRLVDARAGRRRGGARHRRARARAASRRRRRARRADRHPAVTSRTPGARSRRRPTSTHGAHTAAERVAPARPPGSRRRAPASPCRRRGAGCARR